MTKPLGLFAFVTLLAVVPPARAQETRLSPGPGEARFWTGVPGAMDHVGVSASFLTPRPPSSAWREAFFAGYLFGVLGGLAVATEATLPRTVGFWLQGWYRGVDVSADPSRLGSAPPPRSESGVLPRSGGSSVLGGLMEGFFGVLHVAGTRVR